MVEFFTQFYLDAHSSNNKLLNKVRFYSFLRFLVRTIANFILPLYFNATKKDKRFRIGTRPNGNEIIVSFTTFPARIRKVHLVVESLLRQSIMPDRIVLWLSKDQFLDENTLPRTLLKLKDRGLEIMFREGDLKSHKKYYYVRNEFPDVNFIIIDDDVFYPRTFIETLFKYHKRFPDNVCFNRGYKVRHQDNGFLPYRSWSLLTRETPPSTNIMPIGVGGVLYPKGILPEEALNTTVFLKACLYADDIWLYFMVLMNGKSFVKTDKNGFFIPILNTGKTLTAVNVLGGANDEQLQNLYEYYSNAVGFDLIQKLNESTGEEF